MRMAGALRSITHRCRSRSGWRNEKKARELSRASLSGQKRRLLVIFLDLHILELREDAVGIIGLLLVALVGELLLRLFDGFWRNGLACGQQRLGDTCFLRCLLALALQLAGRLLDEGVEFDLRAEAERDGVNRLDIRRVPMASVTD